MRHPATRFRAPLLAALLAGTLALGCGDSLGPYDVAGRYALQAIAGEALPAVSFTGAYVTVRVIAETLLLRADGTGTAKVHAEVEELSLPPGARRSDQRWERALRFRTTDDRLEIEFVCGPAQLCARPPHLIAQRRGSTLLVEYALGERVPQLYRRLTSLP